MKTRPWVVVLYAVIMLPILIYTIYKRDKDANTSCLLFYHTKVASRITTLWFNYSRSASTACTWAYVQLDGKQTVYLFHPVIADEKKNRTFYKLASVGDSIVKAANSDSLLLITSDREYYFLITEVPKE